MHHTLELILSAYIQAKWPTSWPTDTVFGKFKTAWPKLKENFKEVSERAPEKVKALVGQNAALKDLSDELAKFFETSSNEVVSYRGDYQEFFRIVQVRQKYEVFFEYRGCLTS